VPDEELVRLSAAAGADGSRARDGTVVPVGICGFTTLTERLARVGKSETLV
jgi:hypothetical protein